MTEPEIVMDAHGHRAGQLRAAAGDPRHGPHNCHRCRESQARLAAMARSMGRRRKAARYASLGVLNSLVVYAVYTPYVFLWVGFTWAQYVRWLEGGIAFSLMTGWLFAAVILWAGRRFDARFPPEA